MVLALVIGVTVLLFGSYLIIRKGEHGAEEELPRPRVQPPRLVDPNESVDGP